MSKPQHPESIGDPRVTARTLESADKVRLRDIDVKCPRIDDAISVVHVNDLTDHDQVRTSAHG
jgi:hypothetical protein